MSAMRTISVLAGLLIAVCAAPAASAQTWQDEDPRHDVQAVTHYGGSSQCGVDEATTAKQPRADIRRLTVDHGPETIALSLSMKRVKRGDGDTSYLLRLRVPGGDRWNVRVSGQFTGEPVYVALLGTLAPNACGEVLPDSNPTPCTGLTGLVDPRLDRVEVSLPRACVGNPDWVRVGAESYVHIFADGHGSYASWTDTWSPDGATAPGSYGPRVRQG
jgi:hypothetical protein